MKFVLQFELYPYQFPFYQLNPKQDFGWYITKASLVTHVIPNGGIALDIHYTFTNINWPGASFLVKTNGPDILAASDTILNWIHAINQGYVACRKK